MPRSAPSATLHGRRTGYSSSRGAARVIIAASEQDSDLYYATRFLAPDPFIFVEIEGRKTLLLNELEVDRGKKEASVDQVLCTTEWVRKGAKSFLEPLVAFLRRERIRKVVVPHTFPHLYAVRLVSRGFRVKADPSSTFFPSRLVKRPEEIAAIRETQRAIESAVQKAIDLLREARIEGDSIRRGQEVVTSELLNQVMDLHLHENGFLAQHTIVASGRDACDPHCRGAGPIRPHQALVIDIFPRSIRTRYFSDMTRTFVKGRPSDELQRLYDTVLQGQKKGLDAVRHGASGRKIHQSIMALFKSRGYKTGIIDGRMQGFFHGTGHGLGLDIHEPPRLARIGQRLVENNVVTVEPGLYYPAIGGVRIEDTVLVTRTGCENLARFPKEFVIP